MTPAERTLLSDRIRGLRLGKEHDVPLVPADEFREFVAQLKIEGLYTAEVARAVVDRQMREARG